jgi:hypothetical protein
LRGAEGDEAIQPDPCWGGIGAWGCDAAACPCAAALTCAPQLAQNIAPSSSATPQFLQNLAMYYPLSFTFYLHTQLQRFLLCGAISTIFLTLGLGVLNYKHKEQLPGVGGYSVID